MPGVSSAIAIGATPPTSATAGTGIWIDRTGLYGLNANVQQAYINSTGQLIAGAGVARADANGFTIIPTDAWNDVRQYRIATADGSVIYSGFGGYVTDTYTTSEIRSLAIAGHNTITKINSFAPASYWSEVFLEAQSGALGSIYINVAALATYEDSHIDLFNAKVNINQGLSVGYTCPAGIGDITYSGALKSYKNGTLYAGYAFVPLTTPLTNTAWDGDAYSTTAKTLIDLSEVFGVPAGVKAVLAFVVVRDSGSATGDTWLILGPTSSNWVGMAADCSGQTNDAYDRESLVVPCDANGDIYYQINASGAGTMDVTMQIFGYWI